MENSDPYEARRGTYTCEELLEDPTYARGKQGEHGHMHGNVRNMYMPISRRGTKT